MLSRRDLIRFGAASVGTLALRPFGLLPALAQSGTSNYRALVCVFLFGGNDSNNMIIPMDDTRYGQYLAIRGNLALQGSDLTSTVYTKTGSTPYAFHSDLTELASLFSNGELAIAANVGTLLNPITRAQYRAQSAAVPVNLFSHLDQQTQWQTDSLSTTSPTGWAGRAADLVASQNTGTLPPFLSVAGTVIMGNGVQTQQVDLSPGGSLDLPGFSTSAAATARKSALENLLSFGSGMKMAQAADGVMLNSIADANALGTALSKANLTTVFPSTNLGAQLHQVAKIIQVRESLGMNRQVFFCSLGGFDTHDMELPTHKQLYPQLSKALAAFNAAMQEIGTEGDVTTFTESDFSRTFQPTSSDGSDHAWGSHHLIMGGAVKGGNVYGSMPEFVLGGPDDADTRGRWIPSTALDQYGATLCSWLGVPTTSLNTIFPNLQNFSTRNLNFLS
jgi:uncharacterized protein (DUF1501 family)